MFRSKAEKKVLEMGYDPERLPPGQYLTEKWPALHASDVTEDIHCVTRWSRFDTTFRGVHWRDLAPLVRPRPSVRFVVAHAEQGFTSNVPLASLEDDLALLAY